MKELSADQKPSLEFSAVPLARIKQEELSPDLPTIPHLKSTSTLATSLSDPQKHSQSINNNRRTPCEYCRKVRRACKWVDNFQVCERCLKSGRVCTGPTRQLATASIGPSSPESRWSSLHLSYSLTYHLVETGLETLGGAWLYPGFDYQAFAGRFRASQGRFERPDSINELFAMSQMFWGSRCTNHSAVVRAKLEVPHLEDLDLRAMPSTKLISIGLARRNPILAVTQRVIERAEQMNLSTRSPQEAAEQLSVWLCTVKWMIDL
ncbi:hypothetical protein JCM5350_004137 [Sporobolomyces pararoseus]